MRKVHRYLAVIAVFLGLYVGCTGAFLQTIDLKTLLSHAPDSDPNLKAIREGRDGPPNFQVLVDGDYLAPALPADFNFDAALAAVMTSARADSKIACRRSYSDLGVSLVTTNLAARSKST